MFAESSVASQRLFYNRNIIQLIIFTLRFNLLCSTTKWGGMKRVENHISQQINGKQYACIINLSVSLHSHDCWCILKTLSHKAIKLQYPMERKMDQKKFMEIMHETSEGMALRKWTTRAVKAPSIDRSIIHKKIFETMHFDVWGIINFQFDSPFVNHRARVRRIHKHNKHRCRKMLFCFKVFSVKF